MASNLLSRVAETIREIVRSRDRLVVGVSGGIDSVVLLDLLARLASRRGFKLSAIHVNHQLSRNAPRWAAFCRALCRDRGIPLRVVKVTVPRGDSVEAAARAARYAVFRELRADHIALAHNQDDQVETLLLQLLRGAGVKGLAAMPLVRDKVQGARDEAQAASGKDQGTRDKVQGASDEGQAASGKDQATRDKVQGARDEGQAASGKDQGTRDKDQGARDKGQGASGKGQGAGIEEEADVRGNREFQRQFSTPGPGVVRPLLDVSRSEIERYARERKLEWVEDESNTDAYFVRNFLRRDVLPLIATRYPAYRTTLARSARNFADAAQLLDELGAKDADGNLENGTLSVAALRRLAPARARNLLRYFLSRHGLTMPAADRLEEALRQALTAKQDARVLIELNGARLRRFAGRLHVVREGGPLPAAYAKPWRGQRNVVLPELGGVLVLARGRGAGISLARLRGRPVTIGVRRGGERLQPDCRRPRRSLKNLFQEARVPPWQRGRTPLIFCGGELVWAAGVGVDCTYRSAADEPALRPAWMPFT